MGNFNLAAAMAPVFERGAKTGMKALYAQHVISTVADFTVAQQLAVAIFEPLAREEADDIRHIVATHGGSETDAQVLVENYRRGLILGAFEGRAV